MSNQDQATRKLVIPAGVGFEVTENGVSIEHDGDVVITGPLRHPLSKVIVNDGSVTVLGELELGEIIANGGSVLLDGTIKVGKVTSHGGTVTLNGKVEADEVHSPAGSVALLGEHTLGVVNAAEELDLDGSITAGTLHGGFVRVASGGLKARAIEGTVRVELGRVRLAVEVIIAPDVRVDAATTGRVNVVESHNELGPNGLKGGFRLSEYAEFTGADASTFLEERGVRPLSELQQITVVPSRAGSLSNSSPEDLVTFNSELQEIDEEYDEELSVSDLEPVELEASAIQGLDEGPDPVEVTEFDDESAESPEEGEGASEGGQLTDAVASLAACYAGAEEPPPVGRLRDLVSAGDHDLVKGEIKSIWTDLLRYHKNNGLRIGHQVTSAFNTIHTIVSGS